MIVLVARYKMPPSRRPEVEAALAKMADQVHETEPGCRLYQVLRSTEDAGLLLLVEHYEDEAALLAHRETPHFREIVEGTILPLLHHRQREVFELVLGHGRAP